MLTHSLSPTLSQSLTLSVSLSHPLTLSLSISPYSLSHSHSDTLSLSLTHSLSHLLSPQRKVLYHDVAWMCITNYMCGVYCATNNVYQTPCDRTPNIVLVQLFPSWSFKSILCRWWVLGRYYNRFWAVPTADCWNLRPIGWVIYGTAIVR